MNAPESDHEHWVAKAENDLLNIENNIGAGRVPWDTVCFHAQQVAEKYLKALLVRQRTPFPRTHDLEALLTLCLRERPALAFLREDCIRLTTYAVGVRYPLLPDGIGETEGGEMVQAARRVRAAISPLLADPP